MRVRSTRLTIGLAATVGLAAALFGAKIAFASAVITSVSPAAAPNTGTVRMTINGTGFLPGASARLVRTGQVDIPGDNVINGTNVSYESLTRIKATFDLTTRSPGSWDVKVTQLDGTGTCTACFAIASAAPQVSSVSPGSRGQGATDEELTITGSNFARAAAVSISGGGLTLGSTNFVDTTHLTVDVDVASGAAATPRNVTVTNTDGQSNTCTNCFTVNASPTVTSTSPDSRGQGATNQNVVVTGTNFVDGASAGFGLGVTVNSTTYQSPTALTANVSVSPAAVPGARDVSVSNGDGGVSSVCDDCFTVNAAPAPITASPASRGQGVSNVEIEISGTGFVDGASVSFSGGGITVNSTTFDGSGLEDVLIANVSIAGDAATGARNVTVTNPDGGAATCASCFTVNARPSVTSIDPASRGQGADDDVTINGSGFTPGAIASFSGTGITVDSTTYVSPTELTADVSVSAGATTGARDVVVTNTDGGTGTCQGCFSVNAKPSATSVSPGSLGRRATEEDLTITGQSFLSGATVSFSGIGITVNSVSFVNATTLTANVSVSELAGLGAHNVTVQNPDGGDAATCTGCFSVNAAPTISSVDPISRGQGASGHDIEINGSGYVSGATVSFSGSGVSVNSVSFVGASQLVANVNVAQDADVGPRDVAVANPDAGNATCEACFAVASAPAVTLANPEVRGQGAQDEDLTIAGAGFSSGAVVSFSDDDITVNSVDYSSPASLDVNVSIAPDTAVGSSDIVVVNPDGGTGECADCFTVGAGPDVSSASPNALNRGATNRNIAIAGTGFNDDTTLDFGPDVTVSSVSYESATSLVAKISIDTAAAAGSRDIVATNPDAGTLTCGDCFTVGSGPVVNSVSPVAALNSGPVTLTFNGAGYTGSPTVHLVRSGYDDIVGSSVTVLSPTQLTAAFDLTFTPPGQWTARVTGTGGSSDSCRCFSIAQSAPDLSSLDPNAMGQGADDVEVSLTGSSFAPGATVSVSGSGVTVDSLDVQTPTSATALFSVASGAAAGPRNVTITNSDEQEDTCIGCLIITLGPIVDSVTPDDGGQGISGRELTVAGANFANGAEASFSGSGVTVDSTAVEGPTSITLDVSVADDAATGPRDLTITNPDGGTKTCNECFTVNVRPTLTSVSPASSGRGASSHAVSLVGTGFANGAVSSVSGTGVSVASTSLVSATNLTATLNVSSTAALGSRDVTVLNPDGGTATCENCFAVTEVQGRYTALMPARVLDTRDGTGGRKGKLGAGQTISVPVLGVGGVPSSGVSAVALNVIVTEPTSSGYATVYATGTSRPTMPNVNFVTGRNASNVVVAKVGTGGKVNFYNSNGQSHAILDVQGWYGNQPGGNAGRYQPLNPARVFDTRNGLGGRSSPVAPGQTVDVQLTGRGGIPSSGVSAVVMNVTLPKPSADGYLEAYPSGVSKPRAANVTYLSGQATSKRVIGKIGSGGRVKLYNSGGTTDIIVDVNGWFTDASSSSGQPGAFVSVAPSRVFNSTMGTAQSTDVQITGWAGVPTAGVSSVVLNVTGTNAAKATYLTAHPTGSSRPAYADMNLVAGKSANNLVVVKVGTGGKVRLYNNTGDTKVTVEVLGYYVAP